MECDGVKRALLTRSSSKRVLRGHDISKSTRAYRRRKYIYEAPLVDRWHFTKKWEPSVQKFGDSWILVVRYCRRPERKICQSNLMYLARTVDGKFSSINNLQRTFSSKKEANDYLVRFRKHVEYVLGINHKNKVSNEPKVLKSFVSMFNCKRILNLRKKFLQIKASLKVACERRSSWQSWREETISVLEYHISKCLTCQLLRDPPEDGMVVS